jgi:hypothetical protein
MPFALLLDEHLRGPLWQAILRHNLSGGDPIDAVRVGDPSDLPLGAEDPAILRWAERESRILVTEDRQTMAAHLADHLAAGRHSPGIIMTRPNARITELLEALWLIAYAAHPEEIADAITYMP